jgi:hypothetical protein
MQPSMSVQIPAEFSEKPMLQETLGALEPTTTIMLTNCDEDEEEIELRPLTLTPSYETVAEESVEKPSTDTVRTS